ncbi:hypothetical protein Glove_281g29 [Diversispora epigaea]|uniref:Uncharacterized protein n=1 Tax=Diversispora epigaea TaxID=1348612 RepID=A0A397I393_9GLOM|nr:hypothetical protein Glove_281g29 [Diversispora epigaea]
MRSLLEAVFFKDSANIPFISHVSKIKYCPRGHSPEDLVYSKCQNFIYSSGNCDFCTKERFIQEFKTWFSGNANIDNIIQESQITNARTDGGHGSVYSAIIENGIKWKWHFIKRDWESGLTGYKVALKEIKDSRFL